MLHLITPLYRVNNLEIIYSTIINQIEDFNWHLIEGNETIGCSNLDFLKKDSRVFFYKIETFQPWGHEQRNFFITDIGGNDNDFCFYLDDDTVLTFDLVDTYEKEKDTDTDLVLFSQKAGLTEKVRLYSYSIEDLSLGKCDVGSYLLRYRILKDKRFHHTELRNCDGHLADEIRRQSNKYKIKIEKDKFTRYNALSLNIN